MGYQEKKSEESGVKSSGSGNLTRRHGSPLSRRESSPRSTSLRNKSVSPSRDRYGRFQEQEGDLFTAPLSFSLAHCVSADMKMSAGIAVHFKRKFGRVDNLLGQRKGVGEVAYLKDGSRYIFYLVTKSIFHDKPTEHSLEKCLVEMRQLCRELKVKKLAMPRIGCGLDGLEWLSVSSIIQKVFAGSGVSITVYSIERRTPWSKSPGSYLVNRKQQPYFARSEPLMTRDEYMNRKRLSLSNDIGSTPKRRCVEKPLLKPVLAKIASNISGSSSATHLRQQKEISKWETDSSSTSSSDESEAENRSSKTVAKRPQKTINVPSSDKVTPSSKTAIKKETTQPSKASSTSSSSSSTSSSSSSTSSSSSASSDEDVQKKNESVTRRVEIGKDRKVTSNSSGVPSKLTTPRKVDARSPKNMITNWDTSSGSDSEPSASKKGDRKLASICARQSSTKEKIPSKAVTPIKKNESSPQKKRQPSGFSQKQYVDDVSNNKPKSSKSPVTKGEKYIESHVNQHSSGDEFSNDLTQMLSKDENSEPKSSDNHKSVVRPLFGKRQLTQHINKDFLSASDESDNEMDIHQSDESLPPINHSKTNRIFIMDSPERPSGKGLSSSMKQRLGGLPVKMHKKSSNVCEEETVRTTLASSLSARLGLPAKNLKRSIEYEEKTTVKSPASSLERLGLPFKKFKKYSDSEEETAVETPAHRTKVTAFTERPRKSSIGGTMYSDRESAKTSIKERLSLGSRLGR